jgi:hypothetical protein
MASRMQKLRDAIIANHPKSRLKPKTAAEMKALLSRHPKMPAHLRDFFSEVGCGSIGESRYMIYALISPTSIFDEETASGLKGVLLVGDDFAGRHEAYDTRGRSWQFGTIGESGKFRPCKKPRDFPSFIAEWYGGAAAG